MKVCFFTWQFLPIQGGQEYGLHYLANALGHMGHEVVVLTRKWPQPRSVDKTKVPSGRYKVRYFRWLRSKGLLDNYLAGYYLRRAHRRFGFDVILAKMAWPAGYFAAAHKESLGVPLVIGVVGIDILKQPELGRGFRLISPKVERQIQQALGRADAVLAYTPSLQAAAVEAGAPENRTAVMPNGVDFTAYQKVTAVKHTSPYILSIGRFVSVKGHDVLLRAFRIVAKKVPDLQLVLVGGGPVPQEYYRLVQELGVAERVKFIEFVAGEEKVALLQGCVVLAQPSRSDHQIRSPELRRSSGWIST